MTGFRDLNTFDPTWLTRQWGERWMYTPRLQLDAIAEAAREGVRARAPGADGTPPDALVQIGLDRVIVRGGQESDASFAGRLTASFDSWARAASAEGMMRSLQGLLRDADTPARHVSWWGVWAYCAGWDEPVSYEQGQQDAWTWGWQWSDTTAHSYDWGQTFPIMYPAGAYFGPTELGAGLVIGDGTWTVGVHAPFQDVQAARVVADQWRSATTRVRVIVSFDPDWPSHPEGPASSWDQPDETWAINHTVVGGVSVPSRYLGAAYLDPVG